MFSSSMRSSLFTFRLFCLVSPTFAGIGPIANLHIVNRHIAPDGFNRSTVLAGSTPGSPNFPGPLITGFKGANFKLNVIDSLIDITMLKATSIHWHGFFQAGTPWEDGPVGVSQCPIAPGQSFLYEFNAPDQAGTFWYHSHYSTQYCDGLRGAFVVYDLRDPHRHLYDLDNDNTVITLADWYHFPAPQAPVIAVPSSTLINGKGRYAGGPSSPLSVVSVVKGKRYRFRLVSISCDPNYVFSIDGHTMTIIEVDGINVQPLTVDSIQIFAGQRYSIVLKADQPINNYWVRAKPNIGNTTFDGGINSAILRYKLAPIREPNTSQTPNSNPLLETNLHPLVKPAAPGIPTVGAADVSLNIAITFSNRRFSINEVSFVPPTVPVLLQILSGTKIAQDLLPPGSVFTLPRNKVIEVSIPGGAAGAPHAFSVIRSAGSSTYNYANPVRRDVVSTGGTSDNVTIRFRTDNSGPWIFHCHINWHLEHGLAIVFAEDVANIAKFDPPSTWDALCPAFDAANPDG